MVFKFPLPRATSLSLSRIFFPVLGKAGPLVGQRVESSEPRFWVCWKPGGCFYVSPMKGSTSLFPRKVYSMAVPYKSPFLIPPESA